MQIRGLTDCNFQDFRLPSFYIVFPSCTFKCEKDCNQFCCFNRELIQYPAIEVTYEELRDRYMSSTLTKAIVCGGLEPFDSFDDLIGLIKTFREVTEDFFVIYTGYTEEELTKSEQLQELNKYSNIIVKFGRFVPDSVSYYDETLGIFLASSNQYAKKIS